MIDIDLKLFSDYSFNIKDSRAKFDTLVKDMSIHIFHIAHNSYLLIRQGNDILIGYGYVEVNTDTLSLSEDAVMVMPLHTEFALNSESEDSVYEITENLTLTNLMQLYVSVMNNTIKFTDEQLMDANKFLNILSNVIVYLNELKQGSLCVNNMRNTELATNYPTLTTKLVDINQLFFDTDAESFFVLNRNGNITLLPYKTTEEDYRLSKRYMISVPLNTSFSIHEGDKVHIGQLDENTTIENLLILWRYLYDTDTYRLDSTLVNPDIILETIDIIPDGYQEVASNIFMIILKDTATIEAELAKKNAVRISYTIEVTLNALTDDNPSQPFYASLWEEVAGERFHCYSDWGISHEDAFAKVLHFYNTFKNPQ